MTNSIGSLPSGQAANTASEAQASASAKPVGGVAAPETAGPQGGEAVTLSADAQTTAQLLDAARGADGVDTSRVSQLRGAVQSGTYNVSPDDVAKAIAGAAITATGPGGGS